MANLIGGALGGFVYDLLAVVVGVVVLLGSLLVSYVVLKTRDARQELHDPQLGMKVALHYFFSLGVLLFVGGAGWMVSDMLVKEGEAFTADQRRAAAILCSGLIFAAVHGLILWLATNDLHWPAVRRLFTGWRFALIGFVVLGAITYLLILAFQERPDDREARIALAQQKKFLWGTLAVWVPAWLVHLAGLWWDSRKPDVPQGLTWETGERPTGSAK